MNQIAYPALHLCPDTYLPDQVPGAGSRREPRTESSKLVTVEPNVSLIAVLAVYNTLPYTVLLYACCTFLLSG
jgi:hypothetical protein